MNTALSAVATMVEYRWFFPRRATPRPASKRPSSETAYHEAVRVSDDLIQRMRESSIAGELVGTLMANRHNIPFLTSVYETVQEMDMPRANGLDRRHRHNVPSAIVFAQLSFDLPP